MKVHVSKHRNRISFVTVCLPFSSVAFLSGSLAMRASVMFGGTISRNMTILSPSEICSVLFFRKFFPIQLDDTSKTHEGRSATFGLQGLGSFPYLFFFFFSGAQNLIFWGLNCCTISCNISFKKTIALSRLGACPVEARFCFFSFFLFLIFLICLFFTFLFF